MTVKGILCFSWKNLIFTLLFKINFIYNQGALNQEKAILKMNNIIMLKGSDFSFTSPIVLGSVGVVAIIILVLMVIYYIRNKKSQEDEKKPNVEKKEKNEKDENKDNEEVKDEEQECKEVENIENIEKPEVVDKGDTTLEVNNADHSNDVSNRALIVTPLEKKEKRISELFQDFADKMNNHTADITLNDRDEFLKPVYILNANNEQVPIASEASKISKISLNKDLNKLNHHELAFFTNERRDSPNNSFYEAKKEETEQFVDNVEDDSKHEMPLIINRNHSQQRENDEVQEYEEDYEEEEEEVAYKEITPSQDAHAKMNLNPPKNDVISDFDELTKNRKIELFKKNTQELEKEEQSKLNENKDIKVTIKSREETAKPLDIISHTPKRKVDEVSANKLENKSQIEKVSKITNKLDKEEKDLKKKPILNKEDNKSDKEVHDRNQEIIRLKDTHSKDIKNKEIKDKNYENTDFKEVKHEIDEVTPVPVNLSKGIIIK